MLWVGAFFMGGFLLALGAVLKAYPPTAGDVSGTPAAKGMVSCICPVFFPITKFKYPKIWTDLINQ